jgi:hypothetical protein
MTRKLAIVIVPLAAGGLLWVILAGSGPPPKPQVTLPDGSILTVEQVTSSAPHQFYVAPETIWDRLARSAPAGLRKYLPRVGNTHTTSAPSNAIVVWVSMFLPQSNRYVYPDRTLEFEIADEHGCTSHVRSRGSHRSGLGMSVNSLVIESFQRRSPTFKLRLRERPIGRPRSREVLAELDVPNPVSGPFPRWRPEPMPIARTNGDLAFVLRSLPVNRRGGRAGAGAVLEVLRNGHPAREWSAWTGNFADATGNSGYDPFCTNEPAWRITGNFFRNQKAEFSPDEIFAVTNVPVPSPGLGNSLMAFGVAQGMRIELMNIAGAGRYTYSNGVIVASEPLSRDQIDSSTSSSDRSSVSSYSSGGVRVEKLEIERGSPYLVLRMGRLADDLRLLVRGQDERGRLVTGDVTGSVNDKTLVRLTIPEGARRLNLQIIVHRGVIEEFVVVPPRF